MKKLLLILFVFVSVISEAQVGIQVAPQYPYGYIYNKTSFYDTSDFRNTANTTTSIDTSLHLIIGSSGTDSTGNVIKMLNPTLLEKWVITTKVKILSTGKGVGVGIQSTNNAELISTLGYVATAGVASGKANVMAASNSAVFTSQNVSGSALSLSAGDTITLTYTRADSVMTLVVAKGASTSTATFTYNVTGAPLVPNTCNWGIWCLGGSYAVLSHSIYTATPKNANLMVVSDSKGLYFAGTFGARYANRVNATYPMVVDASGGGDLTDHVILRLNEIKAMHPVRVLLNIGSNDKRNSRTYTQWSYNYDYITDQLEKAGIKVYHLLQLNESVLDFSDYNRHINLTYPASRIVNAGTISLFADGIHPDAAGHKTISDSIISQIGLQLVTPSNLIPASRLTDIITYADSSYDHTWSANRIRRATSDGLPKQIPFGAANYQGQYTTPSVNFVGGLSQSIKFTFDSSVNNLHIGSTSVGLNISDLTGNGAFISQGFSPNASTQYIPTTTSGAAIYMSGGSMYFYQNAGLTPGTSFSINKTFQSVYNSTTSSVYTFNPSYIGSGTKTFFSQGDAQFFGALYVKPYAGNTGVGKIVLDCEPIKVQWQLENNVGQFILRDVNHSTAPVAIDSGGAITNSLHIYANGNISTGGKNTDSAALLQLPVNTTTNAQLFLKGSTVDVTSPTQGMAWYNATTDALNFRHNGVTTNLLSPSTPTLNAVTTAGATTTNAITTGSITLGTAGNKLSITEGTDGRVGQTTLVSGTKAITINGLTTSSRAFVTLVSQGGTSTTTYQYAAVCTSNTLTITAITTAGATVTTDTSVLNYFVIN